ncbi:hypothetical protein QQF64_020399 [Cirrhinus molitorella]|uniref:Uncharacterized protein n=1 Tax=Cirrhinus molitorella TaxID=172907 RepID=A0ABR3L917_9TELE
MDLTDWYGRALGAKLNRSKSEAQLFGLWDRVAGPSEVGADGGAVSGQKAETQSGDMVEMGRSCRGVLQKNGQRSMSQRCCVTFMGRQSWRKQSLQETKGRFHPQWKWSRTQWGLIQAKA